jgi:hypothetical protein
MNEWLTLKWFCKQHPDVFATTHSLRWFTISHRDQLVKAQAIGKLRGKVVLHEQKFLEVVKNSVVLEVA